MTKNINLQETWAALATAEMKADIEKCGCVGQAGPSHTRDRWNREGDVLWYNAYQCDSRSRTFNPATGQVEGRAHCSCDWCY